jgi:hypothetical protein
MTQRLGRGPVGQRIRLPVRDGARLQQGDEPQPPPEQAEDGITQAGREVDDLGGVSTPRGAVVRAGDGVAQCGQGGREGRVVTGRTGLANRLGSQLEPPGLREEQRRGDRQPGGDQFPALRSAMTPTRSGPAGAPVTLATTAATSPSASGCSEMTSPERSSAVRMSSRPCQSRSPSRAVTSTAAGIVRRAGASS